MPSSEDLWEDRARKFSRHPIIYSFGIFLIVAFLVVVVGFFGGWFSGTAKVAGFDNSKAQGTAIRQSYESMMVQAETICDVEKASREKSESDPLMIEDPVLAYKAQYRRAQEDYNRRMSNMFEAGKTKILAGVRDLPDRAPSIKEMQQQGGLC